MAARRSKPPQAPKGRSEILHAIADALMEWAKFYEERREQCDEAKAARQKTMTLMVENHRLLKWCRDNLAWYPEMDMVFTCLGKAECEWATMKDGDFVGWTRYFVGPLAWPGGRSFRDAVNRWADEVEQADETGRTSPHATVKNRFRFLPGQALFDGKDLDLPTGLAVHVLTTLVENFGTVVAYGTLDDKISGKTADDLLRAAKCAIQKAFAMNCVPCEIKTKPREGYVICENSRASGR